MAFGFLVAWYKRYERPISSLSLIGGFVFDALTLKRVDLFWENFWVIVHLLVVGTSILVLRSLERETDEKSAELRFWLINILQFTFGGLFSTFLVFYFRSAPLSISWPFLLLLAVAFIANERLKGYYVRLTFQIGLFYLSVLSFSIFLVPVLTHHIGPWIFLLSGVVSLVLVYSFCLVLKYLMRDRFKYVRRDLVLTISSIFLVVAALYYTDIIPPIPLSLKDAGIYFEVHKVMDEYVFIGEEGTWKDFFDFYPPVHANDGTELYAYTSIFSPGSFTTSIVHEWQENVNGSWVTQTRVTLPVVGGRDEGYRTYSQFPVVRGKWRVNVMTTYGQVLGRINFTVVPRS